MLKKDPAANAPKQTYPPLHNTSLNPINQLHLGNEQAMIQKDNIVLGRILVRRLS